MIETKGWVAAISDGLCIARSVYGRYGETRVEFDTNHEGSPSDIKNRNDFLDTTGVEVAERITDGATAIGDSSGDLSTFEIPARKHDWALGRWILTLWWLRLPARMYS